MKKHTKRKRFSSPEADLIMRWALGAPRVAEAIINPISTVCLWVLFGVPITIFLVYTAICAVGIFYGLIVAPFQGH